MLYVPSLLYDFASISLPGGIWTEGAHVPGQPVRNSVGIWVLTSNHSQEL